MTTSPDTRTDRRPLAWAAKALLPLVILLGAIFSVGALNATGAHALDLTAGGETINSANPFSSGYGDGQITAKDPDEDLGGNSDIENNSVCSDIGSGSAAKATNCLPIFRWATHMSMVSNVEFTLSQPLDSVSSNLIAKNSITGFMIVGNMAWFAAAFLMDVATNYEIATAIMKPINTFAASIGKALMGSAILGGIVAIALIGALIAFMRRGFDPKRLLIMVGTLAVLSLMVGGSMADKGSGDNYVPGRGSPAWIAQTTASTFKSIADPVANSVAQSADASSDAVFSSAAKKDPYSCYTYAEALYDGYEQNSKGGSTATVIMSRWWMNTSYKAFSMLQYGDGNNLGADYALCHQLELEAVSPSSHSLMNKEAVVGAGGSEGYAPGADQLPMVPASSQGKAVQLMNFWALCAPGGENFTLRTEIPAERNADGIIPAGDVGGEISGNKCGDFANKTTADDAYTKSFLGGVQSFFKTGDNADAFKEIDLFVVGNTNILNDPKEGIASVPVLYDVQGNLTGADRSVSPMVAAIYTVSAIVGAIAMALLAIALLVMKTLSYVMAGFLILAVIAGTISQGTGSAVTFFKQWLGYTFITSITNLLMSFVFLMSTALNSVGTMISSEAIPLILWAGVVPALSIFLLNWVFKKFFKARSPFSLRGMQSYASNPMGVAAAAGGAGMLGKELLDRGRYDLAARGARAVIGGRGGGTPTTGSDVGGADDSEIIGKAQDAPAGSDDAKSPKDAVSANATGADGATASVADGADGVDGKDGVDGTSDDGLVGAEQDDASILGQASDGYTVDDEDGILGAPVGAPSTLGDRINDYADGADDRRNARAAALGGMVDSARYAGTKFAGNLSDRAGALRDKLATGASAVAHPRATAKAGLDALKNRWDEGAGTRKALREHPGAAAAYLARSSATKLGSLGKGAVDKVSGMDKKSLLKGAALYGGLTVATGGLAAPAAVFGAKTLLKHKGAVAGGFNSAKESIVASSKQAYGNYFPGADEASSEMQFRDLNKRIENAKVNGIGGQAGIAADGSDVVGLADDLPLGRERMIAAERESVDREFDVFAEQNGRMPDEREMEAIYARHPFANDVRDQSVAASQGELDLGAATVSGHSNAASRAAEVPEVSDLEGRQVTSNVSAPQSETLDLGPATVTSGPSHRAEGAPVQRGEDLPTMRIGGGDIDRQVNVEGRDIRQKTAHVTQTQGADTVSHRRVEVEHDVNTTVNRGADRITQEHTQVNAHTPGRDRVVDDYSHVSSGRGAEQINSSSEAPQVSRVDKGSYQVGSGAEAASAARRAGLSEADANIIGQRVEDTDARSYGDAAGRSFDPRQMQASAVDVEQGEVTQDRSVFEGQETLDIFGEGDTNGDRGHVFGDNGGDTGTFGDIEEKGGE